MSKTTVLAWHFVGDTLRDGRPVPTDGVSLVHTGPVEMCRSGLHAARRLIDALRYAPGASICRVECGAIASEDADKLVSSRRTILWRVDASSLLRTFARRCALDRVDAWGAPEVVRQWLETGDESLRSAAESAARSAAGSAAEYAARSAAWSAAESAARSAAESAAWSAAWYAARSVAWSVAWSAHNRRLTRMVHAAHRAAPTSNGEPQ